MKDIGKIAGYNILFIFAYDILLRLSSSGTSLGAISMLMVVVQVMFNFIMAIVCYGTNRTPTGHSFLLTTFLVLIIGFGVCVSHF